MIIDMLPFVDDAGAKTFERATPEYTQPAIAAPPDLVCICGNPCCALGPFVEGPFAERASLNFSRDAFTFITNGPRGHPGFSEMQTR